MSGEPVGQLREFLTTPWVRARVIEYLAPGLTQELLLPATYAAQSMAHQFAGGERVAAPALAAIGARSVQLGAAFLDVGGMVAPFLPDDSVPRAVELARDAQRADLLAELAPRVAATAGPGPAMAVLRESAERSGYPASVADAIRAVAPELDAPAARVALDIALAMEYAYASLPVISAIAASLAPDDARRAFDAVEASGGDAGIEVLARLVPRLGDDAAAHVLALAARLPPVPRLTALTALAEQRPGDGTVGAAALAAADVAIGEYTGWDARPVMEDLVRLAEAGLPVRERVLLHSSAPELYDRGGALARVARALPSDERDEVIHAAAAAAGDSPEPWRVLADLSELAPEDERRALEDRAIDAAVAVGYEPERLSALREVYERLPHRVQRPHGSGSGMTVMETADAILAGAPPERRDEILAEALWAHAGAPPPTAAAPDGGDEVIAALELEDYDDGDHDAFAYDELEDDDEDGRVGGWGDRLAGGRSGGWGHGSPAGRPSGGRTESGWMPEWNEPPARQAVVNTGFADAEHPLRIVSPIRPLALGRRYAFWLEVGAPVRGSIERTPTGLPPDLPERARLTVALSAVQGDVRVHGPASAELEVRADGSAAVVTPAEPGDDRRPDRLVFHVDVGQTSGEIGLRCSIVHRNVVLQSRLIRALTGDDVTWEPGLAMMRSDLDYVLARTLDPPLLARVPEHRLSLMLNGEDGTHALQVVGGDGRTTVVHDATFEGGELEDLVRQTRGALRRAAWDSEDPWTEDSRYRYAGAQDTDRLRADLIRLAVRGWRFYDGCVNRLAGGYDATVELEELTRRPARIQVATRRNASLLLPAALLYDQGFDTGLPADQIELCPAFARALDDGAELAGTPCFQGDCPSHDDLHRVCPSGFWGFRHALGLPLSLSGEPAAAGDAVFDIGYDGAPELSVAVSTDPMFTGRAAHEQHLRALSPGLRYADTRDAALELLCSGDPGEVVYFYCHGGLTPTNVPYLSVGAKGEPGIPSDIFRALRIRWRTPRPLVFLNGCHTTALDPGQALNFPARLVEVAAAAGVIGTEITNFEPLASAFAEECLRRFLGGEAIGDAVRAARLALLAQGNPLGLIYIPFVLPSLRLVAQPPLGVTR